MQHRSHTGRAALVGRRRRQPAACSPPAAATQPAAGATERLRTVGGPGDNKTIVFSPLALKIPAMKGLSEGVKAYGESKGYEVIVQDPNLDPQKQVTDLRASSSPAVAGAWAIAVAAVVDDRAGQDGAGQGGPADPQRHARGLRPRRPGSRALVLHHRLRRPGQGDRRGARQLHQREARRQGRGDLRGDRARHRRQGGARDRRQGGARRHRARRRDRHHDHRQRPRRRRRPTSATRCRATRTSPPSSATTTRARSARSAPSRPPARS